MEIIRYDQDAVVAAGSSGIARPTAEGLASGEAATELRGHDAGEVYVHDDVTLEVEVDAVVDTAARKVGRRDALLNVVGGVGGR